MNWNGSKLEYKFASRIAQRAASKLGVDYTQTEMDIIACHLNGCPLNLESLLNAETFDFSHDILGIRRHIDRDTGELGGFFVPRNAESEVQTDADAAIV